MEKRAVYDLLMIGAGLSGLGMGAQLKDKGYTNFVILEQASDLGGVWRDNTYPNAACDIPARLYSYSFYPNIHASQSYILQPEILQYTRDLAEHFELNPYIHLNARVIEAKWMSNDNLWKITLNNGSLYWARCLIPAWGHLNLPSIPNIMGLDDFEGDYFHSSEWNHDINLHDKTIACIGNAASAIQFIPSVAKKAKHLTVFQRTPNWMIPREREKFDSKEIAYFQENPDQFTHLRQEIHDELEGNFAAFSPNSIAQKHAMALSVDFLHEHVKDPQLREKLTPNYGYGCKRILPNNGDYYQTLTQDHVHLETNPIQKITDKGIVTNNNQLHEVDLIIFGTGFKTQAFRPDLSIIGLENQNLTERWENGLNAEAHLGMSVPQFPNMFILLGPNTGLGHNSMITMMEIQQGYILEVLDDLLANDSSAIEIKEEVFNTYNQALQEKLQATTFTSGCSSWYQNPNGKITMLWSGTIGDFQKSVDHYNPSEYHSL